MTDNPHATLSVKGNLTVGNTYAVYDHSSEQTSPGTDLGDNSLFVEGKIGIGTLEPKSDLDIEGSVRIGSNYSGNSSITTDPTNGIIIEGKTE